MREDTWAWAQSWHETKSTIAFAYLVTVLLFARSGLYADRAVRPGLPRIVSSLFQVTVVTLIFALVNGERYSSYYVFYASLAFAIVYVGTLRWGYEQVTGALLRLAGYRRRAILVGTGKHIEDVADALHDEVHAPVEMIGFISLNPRPDNGLRSLGTMAELPKILERHRPQEVIIADPDFPQVQAVELVDVCHQRGVTVRIAPSTMEILVHRAEFVPGTSVPLFELRPPVFDGFDYALKRSFDFVVALILLILLTPLLLAIAVAVFVSSRGPIIYRSIRPGIGGAPFACFKFRTMRSGSDQMQADLESHQRGLRRAVQDPPGPAAHGRRAAPAALLARRAPAARQRAARPDVARRAAAAAAARLRAARGLAPQALPGAARHHRPVAGLRPLGAGLRRPRAARLPLPRALVDRAGSHDPAQDHPRGLLASRRLLAGPHTDRSPQVVPVRNRRMDRHPPDDHSFLDAMTLRRLLSPATALMGRLTYARKFVLIGLVLLVPAGVALKAYWDQQGVQIAFSAKERVGDAYLEPARDLVTHVVEARGLAVRAAAGDSRAASALPGKLQEVDASVAAVGKADASMGSELETTKLWNELEGDIAKAKAAKPRSPQAAFDAWSAATSGATGLIVQVSNGSNLILDPDLDTFYLMDALITKLPAIVDNAGQASDLQVIVAHEGTIAQRIALAGAQGTLRSTASAMNDGYKTSFTHTADGTLTTLGGPLGSTLKAGEAVAAGVDPTGKGAVDEAAAAARGAKAIAAATLARAGDAAQARRADRRPHRQVRERAQPDRADHRRSRCSSPSTSSSGSSCPSAAPWPTSPAACAG